MMVRFAKSPVTGEMKIGFHRSHLPFLDGFRKKAQRHKPLRLSKIRML
jgi:S-adenosylhomocysteine hydrolase